MIEDALVLWNGLINLAVALISNADLNLIQATKNIKLGDCQVSEAIDASCVVNNYGVIPTTVVTPYSWPTSPRRSPVSSKSSVGNGPEPTRVR